MLAGLVIFWGSSFALTKVAVQTLSPEWTVAVRLAVGAAIIYSVMRFQGLRLPRGRYEILWFTWLGTIGSVIPFLLISWGTLHIASGLAGILMAAVPLVVITLAHFVLPDEPLTLRRGAGFILGFIGVVILIGPAALGDFRGGGLALIAQLAVLLAATSYALQSVTARRSPAMEPLQKTAGVLIAGAIGSLLIALVQDSQGIFNGSGLSLISAFVLGIFPTAGAGILLFILLDRAGAGFVAYSNYLIPPFAFITGVLVLDEPFNWQAMAGLIVILAGIAVGNAGIAVGNSVRADKSEP